MPALRVFNQPTGGTPSTEGRRLAAREYHVRSAPAYDVGFLIEQAAVDASSTQGAWLLRDCGAHSFDVGLDIRNAQSGQIQHYASAACRIGERVWPVTQSQRASTLNHIHCRYVQADVGVLMQDSGAAEFGAHTWTNTQFHQNRVCVAAVSPPGKSIDATFVDGESEYDAQDDMVEVRDGIKRALWYWNAGGRLTIRDWNCRDSRVTDHIIVEGPAVVTIDGYNGGGNSRGYLVRKVNALARIEWYGRIAALGKVQGITRWPDGYAITGDIFCGISIDGHPSEEIKTGFPNLARQRTLDLNLAAGQAVVSSWSIHGGQYIGWVWPGASAGILFVGFMITNIESFPLSIEIDMGHGPHEVHLASHETKRYAYYNCGAFKETGSVIRGLGRIRLFGIQVLWGPQSLELQSRMDECLHLGTRSA